MKTIKSRWLSLSQLTILIFITAAASAQVHADFTADKLTGCPNLVVNFKDNSTGNPTSYKWDFGNGSVSSEQSPSAAYFNPGTYTVTLTVTDANGSDVKSSQIIVNAPPVSYITMSEKAGCFPLKVAFKDSSIAGSGSINTWQWDFGDGTLSTDQNPSHTYTSAGTFTVVLSVSNTNGCTAVNKKNTTIIVHEGLKADFDYSATYGCHAPVPVNFTNKSVGAGSLSYKWDFGDGQTSTDVNPTNNYSEGTYTVKLIATNGFGCTDTVIKQNPLVVTASHANFTVVDSTCEGSQVKITNTSTPANFSSTYWTFSDGTTSTDVNPVKTFAPGTYQITLLTGFGTGCTDQIQKTIVVMPKPNVAFTATNNSGCLNPLQVSFKDATTNGASYSWNFGDGASSTVKDPVHPYTTPGQFSVSLTVTDIYGCANTLGQDKLVNFSPLKIQSIRNLPVKGCLPVAISPVAVIKDNHVVDGYKWDFGDGSESTDAAPTHTYTTPGIYDVKLVVFTSEGCTDTLLLKQAVKAGNKTHSDFSANPTDVCASTPVVFTDHSSGPKIDEWLWFFGDGGTSAQQSPTYIYNDTGYFNVTLITTNIGCTDTLTLDRYIHIKPPIAKFDTSYLCSEPLKRIFVDKSVGATSWSWNFGDGNTSTDASPSHTYATPGNYTVLLTVSNGECQHTKQKNVVVVKEQGTLSLSQTETCLNTRVIFNVKNIDPANIAGYRWYFDGIQGGAIATDNNPVAWSFETSGDRSSAVVVTDVLNCRDTLYAPVSLKTYGPKASFASDAPNTCYGNTVNFTDASKTDGTHPITEYFWNFGESTQSYAAGPFSHNYSTVGTYDVKLVVTDSYGCKDSLVKPSFVSITQPVAKFTPSDTALCPATPITFANASTGVNVSYSWDFGDGTTSTDFAPVHSYTDPGSYKVKMVMIDKNGCTAADSIIINVYAAKADFGLSDTYSTCPPLLVNITNKSVNYVSINWDFGDGGNSQLSNPSHVYTYPGSYTVKLSVKNNGGCSDTHTATVVIKGPTGTFDYGPKEACAPGKLHFSLTSQNAVGWYWVFDDGNIPYSSEHETTHSYANAGTYLPKAILQDQFGCQVPLSGVDPVTIHSVKTNILSDTRLICDSGSISFRDSTISDDAISSYLWSFGDEKTSTAKDPAHGYNKTGFYTIKLLTTTNFGCQDSTFSEKYIKVVNSPSIKMPGDTSACEPAKILLSADFVRKDTSAITWQWNFGNGSVLDQQKPDSQTYIHSGSYNVSLKATNSDGCSTVISRTAVIHPKPDVSAGPDVAICRYSPYTLTATGADSYTWLSNPSLSCTNCASPVARPDSLVTYHVTGKSSFGCTNEDSVKVAVHQPFKLTVEKGDTLCKGETFTLKASGADLYQWTPSVWLNDATSSSPIAHPDTSTTYQVIGQDKEGCFKDTQNVRIKVYPIPTVEITAGDNIVVQVGGSTKLTTKNSADVVDWKWFPQQWLSCASCADPVAAPKDKITYSVTASNEGNCTARDQITINLICNNANVFMPNTFSPNGDGANDVFYPRGTGLFNILTFKVFNRWGQLVFQKNGISANDPQFGWDGKLNGQPLQPDVYVYMIEVVCSNNVIFPFKGNVSLIR